MTPPPPPPLLLPSAALLLISAVAVVAASAIAAAATTTAAAAAADIHWPRLIDLPQQRGDNCTSAECRAQEKQRHLDTIQQRILQMLNFSRQPNVSDAKRREKLLRELKATTTSTARVLDRSGMSIKSYAERVTSNDSKEIRGALKFVIKPEHVVGNLRVTGANLHVLVRYRKRARGGGGGGGGGKRARPRSGGRRIKLLVYDLDVDESSPDRLITTHEVRVWRSKWQDMLVPLTVVQRIIDSGRSIMRLQVVCENCTKAVRPMTRGIRPRRTPSGGDRATARRAARKSARGRGSRAARRDAARAAKQQRRRAKKKAGRRAKKASEEEGRKARRRRRPKIPKLPYMEVVFSSATIALPGGRSRREAGSVLAAAPAVAACPCCLRPLYVDFTQPGWNRVLLPRGFNANYCTTHCGRRRPGHTGRAVSAVCVPRRTSPVTLTYTQNDVSVVTSRLQDMTIDECACA